MVNNLNLIKPFLKFDSDDDFYHLQIIKIKYMTIAQQLNIKEFPFEIMDKNGKVIYREGSNGFWSEYKYDTQGNRIGQKYSTGFWINSEYDAKGNPTKYENSDGTWWKREYNANGNEIYYENSTEFWSKREYDSDGKQTRREDSKGSWENAEYNTNGYLSYYENSTLGIIIDNRPKPVELTLEEIASKFGINVNQLKIKK